MGRHLHPSLYTRQRKLNIGAEVEACCAAIRDSEFLEHPQKYVPLTSISTKPLDSDMLEIMKKCIQNEGLFWKGTNPHKLEPLFIEPHDRKKYHCLENKTLKELHTLCGDVLDTEALGMTTCVTCTYKCILQKSRERRKRLLLTITKRSRLNWTFVFLLMKAN